MKDSAFVSPQKYPGDLLAGKLLEILDLSYPADIKNEVEVLLDGEELNIGNCLK